MLHTKTVQLYKIIKN